MSRVTALIGFAEALAAPEVAWSLVDAGFNVIAFARKGRQAPLRHSRHVTVREICPPEVDVQIAQSDLQSLMASLQSTDDRQILFPLDDTAVWLCSILRLERPWILAGPHGPAAELALDKDVQTRMASDAGFSVPQTFLVRTANELRSACRDASLPMILKPAQCVPVNRNRVCKSRSWICANADEVERAVSEWGERVPLLAQPFIRGIGEGIFGLAAPEGISAWTAHRRLRMMNPQGSGSSACVSQPVPQELKPKVEKLLQKGLWRGLFMIELLRDRSGKLWFVELNGRPWGSMALSRRQGFEYPAWHLRLALDQQSQVGVAPLSADGVVCRNIGREIMHLLFVLRGPKSKALSDWPSFWKTLREVMRVHRGDAVYNWRREDPKVFIADCCYTIRSNVFKTSH